MWQVRGIILIVGCLLGVCARAASDVSARYDGRYSGSAKPVPNMGSSECRAFAIDGVKVEKGFFLSSGASAQPAVKGFITEEGYVAAWMARPGGMAYAMDGRLEGSTIIAGYIDSAANCYWTVYLAKQS